MIAWQGDDEPAPTPEQLAAYADGELDGCPEGEGLRRRIEAWLARHPEGAADLEAQRALTRLWQATTPPEPSEAAWADVLARLERVPPAPATGPARSARRLALAAWVTAALAAAAAAVWLAVVWFRAGTDPQLVHQGPPGPGPRHPEAKRVPDPELVEPFPVATSDEVEILSIPGADTVTLVVGELPLQGPMVLVAAGEVEVMRVEAEVRVGGAGPPMVWTPLERERTEP
jgi:hypothetical protein